MMFGYATDETSAFMPMPHYLASRLAERLAAVRHDGTLPFLRPDGKTQVTVRYEDDSPSGGNGRDFYAARPRDRGHGRYQRGSSKHVIAPVLDGAGIPWDGARVYPHQPDRPLRRWRPHGRLRPHRPQDHRRHLRRHGPSRRWRFRGKDCTKVDRSAAYAVRWVAKNVVAAGLARRCEVQIAYAIGVARPVSLMVDTFGTAKVPEERSSARQRGVRPAPGRHHRRA